MAFCAVHMMKIKTGGLGGIQSHMNREHPSKTNPDIDPERTQNNYQLLYTDNLRRSINTTIEVFATETKTVRKDAVVLCDFIVTSDEQTMKAMGEERQREFFEEATRWFADRYGGENIPFAVVHMDETTPHLHIGVVPITAEGRLSAKTLFDKKELTDIQTEFARDVGAKYGLERGIEGSDKKHLSEMRFKSEQEKKRLDALTDAVRVAERQKRDAEGKALEALQRASEARQTLSAVEGQVEALKDVQNRLERDVGELVERRDTLQIAVREKAEQAGAMYSHAELPKILAAAKEKQKAERRMALLEKFVQMPAIRPLWEQFCRAMERGKSRNIGKDERT